MDFDVGAHRFPIVRVEAAVRVDGDHEHEHEREHACHDNACSNFFSASVAARAMSTNQDLVTAGIGELAISSDGVVHGYSGNEAARLYKLAVDQGDAAAQYNLARRRLLGGPPARNLGPC